MQLFSIRKKLRDKHFSKKRRKFNEVLCEDDYIVWQFNVLRALYEPLISGLAKDTRISLTNLCIGNDPNQLNYEYESTTLKLAPQRISYPFEGLCSKTGLAIQEDISKPFYEEDFWGDQKVKKIAKKYYDMVGSSLRYPNRLGYMLDRIEFNHDGKLVVYAYSGNYESNVKRSHVHEYELYRLYIKEYQKVGNKSEIKYNEEELLSKLPIRAGIHKLYREEEKKHPT